MLTEHELEVLNALALNTDDRWLAYQLAGADPPTAARPLPLWLAPALLVLGAFVAIATFTTWWWIGCFGVVLMGLGGWLDLREHVIQDHGAMTRRYEAITKPTAS